MLAAAHVDEQSPIELNDVEILFAETLLVLQRHGLVTRSDRQLRLHVFGGSGQPDNRSCHDSFASLTDVSVAEQSVCLKQTGCVEFNEDRPACDSERCESRITEPTEHFAIASPSHAERA